MSGHHTPLRHLAPTTFVALGAALAVTACTPHSPFTGIRDSGDDQVNVVQAPPDASHAAYALTRPRASVHLDPQRDDDPETRTLAQIFLQRSLTEPRYATPGNVAGVVPDLAQTLGHSDRQHITWTYRLRPGVLFEDGSPVTAREVQHGVSRLYARELRSPGLDSVRALLAVPTNYPGPYAATPAQRAAFERAVEISPDGMTVTFRLRRPTPDFDLIASLPAFGPVLPTRDTRTRYDSRPLSTGPYRISAETGRSLLLVPNLEWSSTTDPLREDQEARVLVVFGDPASSMDRP